MIKAKCGTVVNKNEIEKVQMLVNITLIAYFDKIAKLFFIYEVRHEIGQ